LPDKHQFSGMNFDINLAINKIFLFGLFLLSFKSFSQISGKLYGEKDVAKDVKINNLTTNISTYSDENGDFKIKAVLNDTLMFNSSFYEEKKMRFDDFKLKEKFVVQLKEKINQLDEVVVNNMVGVKEFNIEEYNIEFKSQIGEDVKKNPYAYEPQSDGRLDIIKAGNFIGEKIGKLFKNRGEGASYNNATYITFKDLDTLFSNNSFFNDALLKNKLEIPSENKFLFFYYCEEQKLNSTLLRKENEFLLFDELTKQASVFK